MAVRPSHVLWLVPVLLCLLYARASAVVTCPRLGHPENGRISTFSNVTGTNVTFTCNTGYVYSEDFDDRVCQQDGSWSGLDGHCAEIDCGEPYINNGTYILEGGTGYRAKAKFICNNGTHRTGISEETRSICTAKQLWEPPPPICWSGDGNTWRCPSASLLPYTTRIIGHPYNNKCYQFVFVERYWTQARDYCRRYGGRLVTLPDAATNGFVLRTLNALPWRNRGVWIGLHDRADEMVWEWSTESDGVGERVSWTNWGRGHPRASFHHHRDCVRMVRGSSTWRWHETPCALLSWKYRFICQYEMLPSTAARVALTSPMTPSTRRPTMMTTTTIKATTPKTTTTTTTFKYGVGGDNDNGFLNGDAFKGFSQPTPIEGTTTDDKEVVDIVIPLQLQQNDNDGHTNVLGGVVVSCLIMVLLALLVIIVVYFRRRRQKKTLSSSLTVANPSYCSATCGSIVAANGQTTLVKPKSPNDNEYTDEPLKGSRGYIPPYTDDIDDEYQEVNPNKDICKAKYENLANYEAEHNMNNHLYADPYDVPRKNPRIQLRPKIPTPAGEYLPMDGKKGPIRAGFAKPRVISEGYLTPVSQNRQSNVYAEIPGEEEDTYPLTDNVYETLDDMEKIRQHVP